MMSDRPVRVAIDAHLVPNVGTGVEQVTIGLIKSLGALAGTDDEYVIVTSPEAPDWPLKYLGPNQSVVVGPKLVRWASLKKWLRPIKPVVGPVYQFGTEIIRSRLISGHGDRRPIESPSPFHEGLGVDVIHFTAARFTNTSIPMVFNPHDLQHLHFPEFFSKHEIQLREERYRAGCELAHTVVVASEWARWDFINHFNLEPSKVQVIPWAAPIQTHPHIDEATLDSVAATYSVNHPFVLFPAATWKHKNHIALLQAIAWLRDNAGLRINLISTGSKTDHWPRIEKEISRLKLADQVKFLGVVPFDHLRALYHLTQFVVFPSLYEPASAPIMEAWGEGVPVASSSAAGFPEQVIDGGYLFDPTSVTAIAKALQDMTEDEAVREGFRERGIKRSQKFSWDKTARAYRALYRKIAGRTLTAEEVELLSENWTTSP